MGDLLALNPRVVDRNIDDPIVEFSGHEDHLYEGYHNCSIPVYDRFIHIPKFFIDKCLDYYMLAHTICGMI